MGHYHYTVNLTKKEYLNPHRLGDGLKLLEQSGSIGGVASALIILLAASSGECAEGSYTDISDLVAPYVEINCDVKIVDNGGWFDRVEVEQARI